MSDEEQEDIVSSEEEEEVNSEDEAPKKKKTASKFADVCMQTAAHPPARAKAASGKAAKDPKKPKGAMSSYAVRPALAEHRRR